MPFRAFAFILITLMISGVFVSIDVSTKAQTSTQVNGIIDTDTTWTKANSPYALEGPVAVTETATLTIEQGVQVYFNSYYLQVNGTLVARGTNGNPIGFFTGEGHSSEIRFMPSSRSWDEVTGAGSIIENANIPSLDFKITINNSSPKIGFSNTSARITINGGAPVFSDNRISSDTGLVISGGTPLLTNNKIFCRVIVEDGSPIIFNNSMVSNSYTAVEITGGNPYVSNNNITNSRIGIAAASGVVERNFISSSYVGIEAGNCIVRNNTVESVETILVGASFRPTIVYNNFPFANIDGNNGIILADGVNYDIDAVNNWWGTADTQVINQTIYDHKNDFNLGTVYFVPFLAEPNPQAMPDPNAPIPAPSPTPTYTQTTPPATSQSPSESATPTQKPTASPNPSNNQGISAKLFLGVFAVLAAVIVVLAAAVTVLLRRTRRSAVS